MKEELIRKLLVLFMLIWFIILLTACSSTKVRCVKEHKERTTCIRYYNLYQNGRVTMQQRIYPCEKTVCDQYERVGEE